MGVDAVVIVGALGYDFHVFLTVFKDDPTHRVVAFTVASEQNVGTTGEDTRVFPASLAGPLYPEGIPMVPQKQLEKVISQHNVKEVVFAYSDVKHSDVMHVASRALAAGADFRLVSGSRTMLQSSVPIVSVCAVRTGCGKSQVSRYLYHHFESLGKRCVAVREPMPYGDLEKQRAMRFATLEDLDIHECTIEEREEYEAYVEAGMVIYSGVDYAAILRQAEAEADVIIWDGGNNEISFFRPSVLVVVVDPLRPGHELRYHPGEVNACSADIFVVNKMGSAGPGDVERVVSNLNGLRPGAGVAYMDSIVSLVLPEGLDNLRGKRVVVVEDGPTLTHGGMGYGAGLVGARQASATIVPPRMSDLRGGVGAAFEAFPHLKRGHCIPAMGYTAAQRADLEATLNAIDCDYIVNGSPFRLDRVLGGLARPVVHAAYAVVPYGVGPTLNELVHAKLGW